MKNSLSLANKMEFKHQLQPILEMLRENEKTMSRKIWLSLVNLSKDRIISVPDQYLSGELPSATNLSEVINSIFEEFLLENLILEEA